MVANSMKEKPLGDITIREIVEGSDSRSLIVLTLLETLVDLSEQDGGHKFADHLMRRIFFVDDNVKYDPGDEPAMEVHGLGG